MHIFKNLEQYLLKANLGTLIRPDPSRRPFAGLLRANGLVPSPTEKHCGRRDYYPSNLLMENIYTRLKGNREINPPLSLIFIRK
jgi:hypothetical protein